MARVLYISYTGLLQPLGQSQILQYLLKLSEQHQITLLTYERPTDLADKNFLSDINKIIAESNISWLHLRYHKSPSIMATAYDIMAGIIVSIYLMHRDHIQIVHSRSYVASIPALFLKKIFGKHFVFDMRGFWPDERVDGGIWKKDSIICRITKWFEKKFLTNADTVVSLTQSSVNVMKSFDYLQDKQPLFEVIPTCTNLDLFKPIPTTKDEINNNKFILGYIGSAGTWYLFEEVVACFKVLLEIKPDSKLLILNLREHEYIRQCLSEGGIAENNFEIISARYDDIPQYIAHMDAGVFFIKPIYSKKASSPTKLGEFLACGKPCITNRLVGDVEIILNDSGAGICIDDFNSSAFINGLKQLLMLCSTPGIREKCITTAFKYFSLEFGVQKYNEIYQRLSP